LRRSSLEVLKTDRSIPPETPVYIAVEEMQENNPEIPKETFRRQLLNIFSSNLSSSNLYYSRIPKGSS